MFSLVHLNIPIASNKWSKILLLSLKSSMAKRGMWLCKKLSQLKKEKREKRESTEKMDKCPREIKTMCTPMPD